PLQQLLIRSLQGCARIYSNDDATHITFVRNVRRDDLYNDRVTRLVCDAYRRFRILSDLRHSHRDTVGHEEILGLRLVKESPSFLEGGLEKLFQVILRGSNVCRQLVRGLIELVEMSLVPAHIHVSSDSLLRGVVVRDAVLNKNVPPLFYVFSPHPRCDDGL